MCCFFLLHHILVRTLEQKKNIQKINNITSWTSAIKMSSFYLWNLSTVLLTIFTFSSLSSVTSSSSSASSTAKLGHLHLKTNLIRSWGKENETNHFLKASMQQIQGHGNECIIEDKKKNKNLLSSQHCFFLPVPPNLTMSLQDLHFPQSGCWHTSQTPHRFLRDVLVSLPSIWSWKKMSNMFRTRGVVVAYNKFSFKLLGGH